MRNCKLIREIDHYKMYKLIYYFLYIFLISIILLILIFYNRNIYFSIENDWYKLNSTNIIHRIKKCDSYNIIDELTYNKYVRLYPNSKYYKYKKLKANTVKNYIYYCYTNETCIKYIPHITNNVEPVMLLAHNSFSTKSKIITNCDINIFEGQCKDLNYYKRYNPSYNTRMNITHVKFGVYFAGWHSDAVYHGLVDSLSRIIPFYKFLLRHKEIYIHLSPPRYRQNEIKYILNILGFSSERIINENYIYVDHLYIPLPFYCAFSSTYLIQKFNILLRSKIKKIYSLDKNRIKSIVVIQRLRSRILKNFNSIIELLKKSYPKYIINIYSENNTNLKEVILMFYYADAIIAPHGAGLTNILFCKKGVIVFEIGISHVVNCYAILSTELNIEYYQYYTNESKVYVKYFYVNETNFISFIRRYFK